MKTKTLNEYSDLSHLKCELAELPAEQAAKSFYAFLCMVAETIDYYKPQLYAPGQREESQGNWWVVWEDCPWPDWAITGGAFLNGPNAGWCSMRSGAHHSKQEVDYGPFFHDTGKTWYMQPYWGFDVIFEER